MSVEFFITSLIVVLVPGTGVIYTLAHGLGRGFVASIFAAFGCTLGIIPHILAAVFGLAALLHASALAFEIIKYLGVAYLLYMAWGTFKDKSGFDIQDKTGVKAYKSIVLKGLLINILNPKLSIFFMAFLPQFIHAGSNEVAKQMMVMGGMFMLMTLVIFIAYGICAASVRQFIVEKPNAIKFFRRVFAGTFVLLSARLVLAER